MVTSWWTLNLPAGPPIQWSIKESSVNSFVRIGCVYERADGSLARVEGQDRIGDMVIYIDSEGNSYDANGRYLRQDLQTGDCQTTEGHMLNLVKWIRHTYSQPETLTKPRHPAYGVDIKLKHGGWVVNVKYKEGPPFCEDWVFQDFGDLMEFLGKISWVGE